MNTTPQISVIVPVYNVEKYLAECVDSVLSQTFTDFELLLIDDGSKDGSGAICDEYAAKDSRVRVFHKENGGVSSARNLGLDNANGEWIVFVDADDWLELTMLEKMCHVAVEHNADCVYCDFNMAFENKIVRYKSASYSDNKTNFIKKYIATGWTCLWNILTKKDLYNKHSLYFPTQICYCEDFWLSVRLFHYANRVSYVEKPLYNYNRMNETSIMHKLNSKTEQEERKAYLETIEFFKNEGVYNDYERELSWRILKSTHDSALYLNRYNEFLTIYPSAHKYIWSCPFVNFKCKCIMTLLSSRVLRPFGRFLIYLRSRMIMLKI